MFFGEGFDYWGQSADWWLLEVSGLIFGLTGDMIREGAVGAGGGKSSAACPDPNRWLGTVFGMTARMTTPLMAPLAKILAQPTSNEVIPLWQYWHKLELSRSKMVGWWHAMPMVFSNDDQVKATAFILSVSKKRRFRHNPEPVRVALIALANFGTMAANVTLTGPILRPTCELSAVAIEDFQPPRKTTSATVPILVMEKRGWLLEVMCFDVHE
eukprot:SAG31_NODE_140_length_22731_cov_10.941410_17_plen_213_part_00